MAKLQATQWGILLLKTYDPDPISNSASLPFICILCTPAARLRHVALGNRRRILGRNADGRGRVGRNADMQREDAIRRLHGHIPRDGDGAAN